MHLKPVLGAAVTAALVLTMLSCTGNSPPSPPFNASDVAFAQTMIRLDRRTVELTSLVGERTSDAELRAIAARISDQQHDDIDQMTSWLEAWNRSVPAPTGPDGLDDPRHRGVTTSEVDRLRAARGEDFDRLFAALLIRQHRTAVELARRQTDRGYSTPAVRMAESISSRRAADVAVLDRWTQR